MTPTERAEDGRRCHDEAWAAIRERFMADRLPGESGADYLRRVYPGSSLLGPEKGA